MCILKDFYPEKAIGFASDLQYALNYEGRDLTDDEADRHLLDKYGIHPEVFYERLNSDDYKEKAYYEFSLVKQLQVAGYPCVFIQTGELKFNMVAQGFADYKIVKGRIDKVLKAAE